MNWYKKSQLNSEIINKYKILISEFIDRNSDYMNKILTDKNWAKGTCSSVSRDLVNFFQEKGIKSQVIGCTGLIPELPEDAHEDWLKFKGEKQKYLWHAVVKTEDSIIDLTGGQYGEIFSGVQINPINEYLNQWNNTKIHDKDY